MLIRFAKSRDGGCVLTCIRADGTSTYSKPRQGAFFAPHDLMHYAVESTLGLCDSFFGLVEQGWSLPSFEEPGAAAKLPAQAVHTELTVMQLQQEQAFATPAGAAEFNNLLRASAAERKMPFPRLLTDWELDAVRTLFTQLHARYAALGVGGAMELVFPAPASDAKLGAGPHTPLS